MADTGGGSSQGTHQEPEVGSLRSAKLNQATRRSYTSTIHNFTNWLASCGHENCVAETRVEGKFRLETQKLTTTLVSRYIKKRKKDGVSISSLQGIRSAVSFAYQEDNSRMPDDMAKCLTEILQEAKRKLEKTKRARAHQATAQIPLPFYIYRRIAWRLYDKTKDVKSHLYALLLWNLRCHANKVSILRLEEMHWCQDAVGISLTRINSYNTGDQVTAPKYCFANPLAPEVCTLLSLGIYFLCQPTSNGLLFPGDSVNHAFEQALMEIKQDEITRQVLVAHGLSEMNADSFPKDSSTCFVGQTSACIGNSSMISHGDSTMCDKCGRKIGSLPSTYHEQNSDSFVARSNNDIRPEVPILPPYFDHAKMGDEESNDLVSTIKANTPLVVRFPNMYPIVEHGIASVLFHYDWLQQRLPNTHPVFSTWIFTLSSERITKLCSFVSWNLESPYMQASGVHPHALAQLDSKQLSIQTTELVSKVTQLTEAIKSIGSTGSSTSISDEMLIKQAVEKVLESTGLLAMAEKLAQHETGGPIEARHQATTLTTHLPGSTNHTPHQHSDGGFYSVPEGYEFPRVNIVLSWSLWWLGDPSKHIPPFRELASKGAIRKFPTKLGKYYSEWKSVFGKAEEFLGKLGKLPANNEVVTDAKINSMFAIVKPLLQSVFPARTNKRMAEVKIATLGPKFRKVDIDAFIKDQQHRENDTLSVQPN